MSNKTLETPEGFVPSTPTGLPDINASTGAQTAPQTAPEGFVPDNPLPETPLPPPPTMSPSQIASEIYTPILKYGTAAAAAGAAVPVAAGTGPLAPAVEVGAGALGFATGASLADRLDELIGLKPKTPFFGVPTTNQVRDEAKKTVQNLSEGTQLEMVGRPLGVIAGKALTTGLYAGSKILQKTPEVISALRNTATELGIDLTPAELLASKSLAAVESILNNLPWTSGIMQEYQLGRMQKLNEMRNSLIEKNGSSDDIESLGIKIKNMADEFMQKKISASKGAMEAMKGRLLQKIGSNTAYEDLDISAKEAVQRYQQELSQKVSAAYTGIGKRVDAAVGPEGMVPENTLEAAQQIIKEQESVAPGARNNDVLNVARSLIQGTPANIPPDALQLYQSGNPQIKAALEAEFPNIGNPSISKTYSDLDNNVKAFNLKKYNQVDTVNGAYQISNQGRQWDNLIGAMKQDMQTMAESTGDPELAKAHEIADNLYKQKLALFQDPAFKTINNKYPGAVAKTVLESGNSELINRYKALVGDSLFSKTKDRLTNDVLGLNEGDIVTGDQIRKNVLDLGESAKTIYSDTELSYFQKLATAVDQGTIPMQQLEENPVMKTIIQKGEKVPSGIARAIVKPNQAANASVVEHFFGAEGKKKVADAFLPELLSAEQNGNFKPLTFAKQFDKFGEKTLKSWYGDDFVAQLKRVRDVGYRLGNAERMAGNPSGTGRTLIGFYEGMRVLGKLGKVISSGFAPPALMSMGTEGAMILGTRQLAKLYSSPAGKALFIDGLMAPAEGKAAANIAARITALLENERKLASSVAAHISNYLETKE